MKSSHIRAVMAMLAAASFCSCWLAWSSRATAQVRRDIAIELATQTHSQLRELQQLRQRAAVVDQRERPAEVLVGPLRAILDQEGLGGDVLTAVSMPDPQPIENGLLAKQEATLTLSGVTSVELARILVRWSQGQPLWTIRRIGLDRREAGTPNSIGVNDRFTCVITIDNIHIKSANTSQREDLLTSRSRP